MHPYRERMFAPPSWWLAAVVFAVVWGWVALVITSWTIATVVTVVVGAGSLFAVQRYGSLLVEVEDDTLRVGRASIGRADVGAVEPLNRVEYRRRLGTGADARAHLVTRPYLDRGVLVCIDDVHDPAPYWLLSSRHPDELATALGHTGPAPTTAAHDTIGESPRGEEAQG